MIKNQEDYSVSIDLLRIIATGMVLVVHLTAYIDFGRITEILQIGQRGVQIFFVMSGFLIMKSMERCNSTREFYIKRFNRFVPPYYCIILIIIFYELNVVDNNIPNDYFKLGWLRYFLFLQRIIPTDEVFWENIYALWTISAFVVFYLIAPLIKKYVNTFNKSLVLLLIGFVLQIINYYVYSFLFLKIDINVIDEYIGGTAIHDLYMFFVGVVIYFAIKENKEKKTLLLLLLFIILGIVLDKDHYIWVAITAIYLLSSDAIKIKQEKIKTLIKTLSKYSFAVYLSHMFSFDVAYRIKIKYNLNTLCWSVISIGFIVVISFILVNICTKIRIKVRG